MDGQEVSGPSAIRKESISHNEAFARAPANSDERDGAQIENRRPKVKLVETEPFLTDTYRKKRLCNELKCEPSKSDTAESFDGDPLSKVELPCVDVGRASSAEAATLQSAPVHAGPTHDDADERAESNLTLMWKARGRPPIFLGKQ